MDIHKAFEMYYADQFDTTPENVRSCRLSNGSYNNLCIARAFRMFHAGYELHRPAQYTLIGYLSTKGVASAQEGTAACFKNERSELHCVPVFIRGSQK